MAVSNPPKSHLVKFIQVPAIGSLLRIQKVDSWWSAAAAAALVLALLVCTYMLVYVAGGTRFSYVHAMYVSILAGAAFFGLYGGLVLALLASVLMGPLMPLDVAEGTAQSAVNWLTRAAFFLLIGGLAGLAFEYRSRQLKAVRQQGFYNPLTGLPNRVRCLERLKQLLASADVARSPVVLLSIRISQLPAIATSFGQDHADAVEKAVAERIQQALPEDVKLFHISAGTFTLVAIAPQEQAADLGAALVDLFDEPVEIGGIPILCDAHSGLAQFDVHASDALGLLRASVSAAEEAATAHQPVLVFDQEKDCSRRDRLRLLADLQRALRSSEEIVLYYQPIIDLSNGNCSGAEALVRWHHPARGWIQPADFVPLAEQTALVEPLSHRVLDVAIAQLAAWRSDGLDLALTVNLAIRNLENPRLPDIVRTLLEQHRVDPLGLGIEVTESGLMQSLETVSQTLTSLRAMEISVALDDFGTGQSSIAYLRDLPADVLKLDRSFLRDDAVNDPRSRMLLATAIEGCHRLGFRVTAEGIETESAYELLRQLSCDYGQGFFIARPMPEPEFRNWLLTRRRNLQAQDRASTGNRDRMRR